MYLYKVEHSDTFNSPTHIEARNVSEAESKFKNEYGSEYRITLVKEITNINEILK